jgi:hypothetical protein
METSVHGSKDKTERRTHSLSKVPSLLIKPRGTDDDEQPECLQPEFRKATRNLVPSSGPVASFHDKQELPTTLADRSQLMRFSLHAEDGRPAAWLTKEIFDRGIDTALTLCFGYPTQGDAHGPVTDKDVKCLVRWIDRWVPLLPDVPITLDLGGNQITPRSLPRLAECLKRNPKVQALDLSRNRGLTGLLPAKPKTARRALGKTLTSPRSTHRKKPLQPGEAIADLLASAPLRRLCLSGNPFRIEDRARILKAVRASATLCEFEMADCALSQADVETLFETARSNGWTGMSLGTSLKSRIVGTIVTLLPMTPSLAWLDLGTTEPYSSLEVTSVLSALTNHPCLEMLSLAGHDLWGGGHDLTYALRRNDRLRTLDLSRCAMSLDFLTALKNALAWDGPVKPNFTLTQLILPAFGDTCLHRDELESLGRICSIAVNRNRIRESRFEHLRADASAAFHTGLSSSLTLWRGLPLELCSHIVKRMGNDEDSLRSLAAVVRAQRGDTAFQATPRTWKPAR